MRTMLDTSQAVCSISRCAIILLSTVKWNASWSAALQSAVNHIIVLHQVLMPDAMVLASRGPCCDKPTLFAAAMRMSATICIGTDVRPWAHLARPAMTGLFRAPAICLLLVVRPCLLSLPSAEQQHMVANLLTGQIKHVLQQWTALLQALHKHCNYLAYGEVSRWSCFFFQQQPNQMSKSRNVK